MNKELWDKCVAFHGHSCPGLAIGFRAATLALELLGLEEGAKDEELVCVTENDACGVDAVQVVTGCTMGKGNLIYRGTGKMAFSFYCRRSGCNSCGHDTGGRYQEAVRGTEGGGLLRRWFHGRTELPPPGRHRTRRRIRAAAPSN